MYLIGTTFIRRNLSTKYVETITDVHTTTNAKGEVVSVVYIAEHEFMGQIVKCCTPAATIARSQIMHIPQVK